MKTLFLIVIVLMTSCSSTQFSNHKYKPSYKKYSNKRVTSEDKQHKFIRIWTVVGIGCYRMGRVRRN